MDGNKFTGTVPKELCRKELNDDFFKGVEKSERDYCESVACPMGFVAEDGIYPCHEVCKNCDLLMNICTHSLSCMYAE